MKLRERQMERQTDGHTETQEYNITSSSLEHEYKNTFFLKKNKTKMPKHFKQELKIKQSRWTIVPT